MSASSLHASAVDLLTGWTPPDTDQDSVRHTVLAFLAAVPDACLRASVPGHITASAIVFDETLDNVLLTLHPRVGKWIQLGGHCEPTDTTVVDAATRETREESGLPELSVTGDLVEIHTHPITCSLGVPTRHLDLRFAAVAAGVRPTPVISDESVDLAWWPITDLPADAERPVIDDLIGRALARLG